MRKWRGRPLPVWLLLAGLITLGGRAVLGGSLLVLDPSGGALGLDTAALAGSPFTDFLVPGVVLTVAIGVLPLVVAVGLFRGRPWSRPGSLLVAVLLVIWVVVEALDVGVGERLQYPNLLWALALAALALAPSVRRVTRDAGGGTANRGSG